MANQLAPCAVTVQIAERHRYSLRRYSLHSMADLHGMTDAFDLVKLGGPQKTVKQLAPRSLTVHIAEEDFVAEFLVAKLRRVKGLAHPLITWPNYYPHNSPLKRVRSAPEEREAQAQLENDLIWYSSSRCISKALTQPPSSQAASPLADEDSIRDFSDAVQRKQAKAYRVGTLVEVRSVKQDSWIRDAEIIGTVNETCEKDGFKLRAGSVKVLYNGGNVFRWVPPRDAEYDLRPQSRLRLQVPEPMSGGLEKRYVADASCPEGRWVPMHVEICRGHVQWWETETAARNGKKSGGHAFLLG